MNADQVPELPGYVSVAVAAEMLGQSKPSVYYRMFTQGHFKVIFRVDCAKERPLYLLLKTEVEQVIEREAREAEQKAIGHAQALANGLGRNRRIKAWGHESGWPGFIHTKGAPSRELVCAYEAAHPDDVPAE